MLADQTLGDNNQSQVFENKKKRINNSVLLTVNVLLNTEGRMFVWYKKGDVK